MAPGIDPEISTVPIPIVDMWAPVVPSREIITHIAANLPAELLSYFDVFQRRRLSEEDIAAALPSAARDDEAILAELDAAGIRVSMITGFDEKSTCASGARPSPTRSSTGAAPSSSPARTRS